MQPIEIIVIIAAVSLVIFTVGFNVIKKKRRKKDCVISKDNCNDCPYKSRCNK